MQDSDEKELLASISAGGVSAWERFLAASADAIFRVIRLFADGYDDRMDLFLFVCARLKENDMRRVRAYRYRPEAPCRFSTYLSVVVKNIALDFIRARDGRFRPFRTVEGMDETDRLLFEYHLRDGRPLAEVKETLSGRHGIRLTPGEIETRAERVQSSLSASQRWRLLSRLFERRRPVSVEAVGEAAFEGDRASPRRGFDGDPEGPMRSREADLAFHEAMESMPPRQRLAVVLRYRDGLGPHDVAEVLSVSKGEAEKLAREGVERLRLGLKRHGVARPDLESSGMSSFWPV
ncbi:MAG: sigma-70 family RNA polymerase sigma factor [Acidobacteria bacterium]|nr:sigma-70 family RNA polymerase sigma factor [Acidobacteriota bacterium]